MSETDFHSAMRGLRDALEHPAIRAIRGLAAAFDASNHRIAVGRHGQVWLDAYQDKMRERRGNRAKWLPSAEDRAAARDHANRAMRTARVFVQGVPLERMGP